MLHDIDTKLAGSDAINMLLSPACLVVVQPWLAMLAISCR